MSKRAEQAALELYPVNMVLVPLADGGTQEEDGNFWIRKYIELGYEQAEKDLALIWEDIRLICEIDEDMRHHSDWPLRGQEVYYEEVLRRFREIKEDK